MCLCCFYAKSQPFQLLSLRAVLQHKPQRLKISRHLVLTKHLKHMSKTDLLPPDPIPSTPWPILDDGKYFLPIADVRHFRLTHNPHPIYREIPLALPSKYIQNRPLLFTSTTLTLVWPTIMSHLGYCKAFFSNISLMIKTPSWPSMSLSTKDNSLKWLLKLHMTLSFITFLISLLTLLPIPRSLCFNHPGLFTDLQTS